ncbi:hypothetical protein G4Q83_14025 [Xanthomonas theicola]|nr:hypothetical protein G4Q83_14025 [Xanthomonas theicola]
MLDFLGLALLLFALLGLLGQALLLFVLLGLLGQALLLFALLQRLASMFECRRRLQRLCSRRLFRMGRLHQCVLGRLRDLLLLGLALLPFAFLALPRGAGRLGLRLHVEHVLRAGSGVGGRAIRVGRPVAGVRHGRLRRRRHVRERRGLPARPDLVQRLPDVLGAGDGGDALHAVCTALQMDDGAVCTQRTARPALQLHRAIAGQPLPLACALHRQIDRLAPVRVEFGPDDAVAVQGLLALQVLRRRRRLRKGGHGLGVFGQRRLQQRACRVQFQRQIAIGADAVARPLALGIATVALAIGSVQRIRIGQRLLYRRGHRIPIGGPAAAVVGQFIARGDGAGAVGEVARNDGRGLRVQVGRTRWRCGLLFVEAAVVFPGHAGLDLAMPLAVGGIAGPVGATQAGAVAGLGGESEGIVGVRRGLQRQCGRGVGGERVQLARLLVAGEDRRGDRLVHPVAGGVGHALARPGAAVEGPGRAVAVGLVVDGAVIEQVGGLLADLAHEVGVGRDQSHRTGAGTAQRIRRGSAAGPAADVAPGEVDQFRSGGERVVVREQVADCLAGLLGVVQAGRHAQRADRLDAGAVAQGRCVGREVHMAGAPQARGQGVALGQRRIGHGRGGLHAACRSNQLPHLRRKRFGRVRHGMETTPGGAWRAWSAVSWRTCPAALARSSLGARRNKALPSSERWITFMRGSAGACRRGNHGSPSRPLW